MKLTDLKPGEAVFIDANIFIYHFCGASVECREFLKSCEKGEFTAFTSNIVLAEVTHRLMVFEALRRKLIKAKGAALQLQNRPDIVKKLSEYYIQVTNILSWHIRIIETPEDILIKSQVYRSRFGLLTNDSFIPVFMELAGVSYLVSADKIFNYLPHLYLYSPSDINV